MCALSPSLPPSRPPVPQSRGRGNALCREKTNSRTYLGSQDAECAFGPVFNGTFSGGTIPDQNFKIEYGDGRLVTGALGYEDVTVAGITVQDQQVALVNNSYWFGDSTTSGFMGLAYAYLTSAYQGTNVSADTVETEIKYDPIITTMIKQKLIDPVFSLALKRNSDSGYLALGGLPPVEYTGSFTSTPILMVSLLIACRWIR